MSERLKMEGHGLELPKGSWLEHDGAIVYFRMEGVDKELTMYPQGVEEMQKEISDFVNQQCPCVAKCTECSCLKNYKAEI